MRWKLTGKEKEIKIAKKVECWKIKEQEKYCTVPNTGKIRECSRAPLKIYLY
jgi:hypothetical protein